MLQLFSVIVPDRSRVSGVRSEWHSRGQRFDPAYLHQKERTSNRESFLFGSRLPEAASALSIQFTAYGIKIPGIALSAVSGILRFQVILYK